MQCLAGRQVHNPSLMPPQRFQPAHYGGLCAAEVKDGAAAKSQGLHKAWREVHHSSQQSQPLPICVCVPAWRCRLSGGAPSFRYLNSSNVYTLSDVDDAQEFRWGAGGAS